MNFHIIVHGRLLICMLVICFTVILQLPWSCYAGHSVPTYFHRVNSKGELIDASSRDFQLSIQNFSHALDINQRALLLKAYPATIGNGDLVEISWFGITRPLESDFVALYCPPEGSFHSYLDYLFVNETGLTYKEGYGAFQVALYNLRVSCEFRYIKFNGKSAKLVARSNVVEFKGSTTAPLQGHLALTESASEMRVMWTSGTSKPHLPCLICISL